MLLKVFIMANRSALILLFSFFIVACGSQDRVANPSEFKKKIAKNVKAKNIILLIGDGMGLTQISAGMYNNGNKISLERFPIVGLHKSYSSDNLITDSAAGATAFACGVKTYNGAIGVNSDTIAVQTILEEASLKKLKTGLIATSTIVHATPASFISHNKYRKNYEEIAADYVNTPIDILIGGGKKYFDRRESDRRDLSQEFRNAGYMVEDYFNKDIIQIDPPIGKKLIYYTADNDPVPASQGRDYLLPATKLSLDHLQRQNENGFFIMIEGSQIDWGGHANDGDYVLTEMAEYDQVIHQVLDWAEQDGETLVVVTADHETGGLAIQNGSKLDSLDLAFTSTKHTAVMIPVFAKGPGERLFSGIYENTAIYNKLRQAFGWE